MSAAAPVRAPRPARTAPHGQPARPPRPALQLVEPARVTVARLPFVLLVGAVLAVGLLVLLMLHTLAAQDAFTLHDLQRQSSQLSDTEQELAVANQHDQAPTVLAARAKALGLVPTTSLKFLRLHGRMVAVAHAPRRPAATPAPARQPSVSPSPAARRTASHR